jgi:hypothetical protein
VFSGLEFSLILALFVAGVLLGIFSYITVGIANALGMKVYMLRPVVLAGFVFSISEAFLLIATSYALAFGLSVHFLLETVAIALVIYGVARYYQMLKLNIQKKI